MRQSKTDTKEMWESFPDQGAWDRCVEEHQRLQKYAGYMSSTINDLTLSLEMWLDGYEFDAEYPIKLNNLLDFACVLIGKPRTMEELAVMAGLDAKYVELCRLQDEEEGRA